MLTILATWMYIVCNLFKKPFAITLNLHLNGRRTLCWMNPWRCNNSILCIEREREFARLLEEINIYNYVVARGYIIVVTTRSDEILTPRSQQQIDPPRVVSHCVHVELAAESLQLRNRFRLSVMSRDKSIKTRSSIETILENLKKNITKRLVCALSSIGTVCRRLVNKLT